MAEANEVNTAYCVKCKAKKEIQNGQRTTMSNGRPALKGTCPTCGTTLNRILATPKVQA